MPLLPVSRAPPPSPPRSSAGPLCDLLLSLSAARNLPKGQQLQALLLKCGALAASAVLSNHLVTFYARCGAPLLSLRAFLDSPFSHRPSPAAWSALVAALAQNGLPFGALAALRRALLAGAPPSDRLLPPAAKSAAALALPLPTRCLHALALKSLLAPTDVFVSSALLDAYAKCDLLPDARRLFDEIPAKNVVSWSALVFGYAQAGLEADALRLFKAAVECGNTVNDFTFSCVVRVCGAATLLDLGSAVHAHAVKTGFNSSPFVGSSLVSFYSRCGVVEDAYRMFDMMPERNLGAWNAVLIASAQHSHTRHAFDRFRQMEDSGFRPNFITFLCLLTACSHAGLVDDGKRYYALMSDYGIEPGSQHCAAMVDLLSRAGRIKEALGFIEKMPLKPTESIWGALITGCRIHGDADTAAFAANKLFESGSLSSGAHMLVSNAYAAAGRYTEAANARKAMRDRGVRKETGLSWLEFAGQVHTFVSGDRTHPRSDEIYKILEEVGERIEQVGYVADTSQVLRDVDREEKRRAIWYHSERLAIGLGLLVVAEGQPIRVMKNLRVCLDCHTAIKFLSKCTGRTVVLRDNNRFHRFEGGVCSCGDYW